MTYRIPYIAPSAEYEQIRPRILEAVDRVFSEGSFILRGDLRKFEARIADLTGSKNVIGVNSGYDALYLSLRVLGLSAGDEVIVPSYTFSASVSAIVQAGLKPVFAEIQEDLNVDPDSVERLLNRRTRAIMPVHLNGVPCNMKRLCAFAERAKLQIVEDAAQAFGSQVNGKWVGTFGIFGCFSLHPLKSLSVPGDGGFILTHNDRYAAVIRSLIDHGRERGNYRMLGINSRLDNLHAAVANVKLEYFEKWGEARRAAARMYRQALSKIRGLRFLEEPPETKVVWSNFPIISRDADRIEERLKENGVEVFRHFSTPIHKLSVFESPRWHMPVTEELCEQVVYLPIHAYLTKEDIAFVTDIIGSELS